MPDQGGPVVAIDVGGTAIKGAVVGPGGEILSSSRWVTPVAAGPDAVVATVLSAVEEMLAATPDAAAIGVVVPGSVDEDAGIGLWSENIGWRDVPFRRLIEERVSVPVGFGHDVRAGGIAEREQGSGAEFSDTLFLPIGTGISGAMCVEGRFVGGRNSGEIGHISTGFPDVCVCGATGCLEAIASGASIARRYAAAGGAPHSAAEVAGLAASGDAVAEGIWTDAIEALARALTTYTSILAPELIVLGGGVSAAGDALLLPLRHRLHALLSWQDEPQLIVSRLGDNASCLGAAILARRAINPADKDA